MRILSGIQPSGNLHIGNYFGMMKPMIEYQAKGDLFCFIANLHALTTITDGKKLKEYTLQAAMDFLALGIDPQKSTFWVQSDVPEINELAWYLSNVTPVGLLERSHSYKDKLAKGIPANGGLFFYPVLMAADILAVQSDVVPVGRDQKQHVEITRDIAIKFNNQYGEIFKIPEPEIKSDVAVVPGIDGQKMSKSYGNYIEIFGDEKLIKKKIMSIVTDSTPVDQPKNPDTCTVFKLYSLFGTAEQITELRAKYLAGGLGYGDAKKALFSIVWEHFAPYRHKRAELAANADYVQKILQQGKEKSREVMLETLVKIRKAVGT
jgi:tryptophanyl-tRNA synthetase